MPLLVSIELLAHTDGLEVHAEDGGNWCVCHAEVVFAVDLVQDRVDLQRVVALDVLEAVGPGGNVGTWIAAPWRRRCQSAS